MENGLIYSAITAAMKDVSPILKTKKNLQQGFMFRGVDDVMNELQPIFSKHGIFCVPKVIGETRETRQTKGGSALYFVALKIDFTFYASDGSSVVATISGTAMDSGDKADNKALSIAFKYACLQVFCIPTEDVKDPDAETSLA